MVADVCASAGAHVNSANPSMADSGSRKDRVAFSLIVRRKRCYESISVVNGIRQLTHQVYDIRRTLFLLFCIAVAIISDGQSTQSAPNDTDKNGTLVVLMTWDDANTTPTTGAYHPMFVYVRRLRKTCLLPCLPRMGHEYLSLTFR
jgi:hypothetical protein